ncbi:hypothetical protein HZP25_15675 [Elizabethkingia anophelis]|nr:hypothetical protein [Elizabethkingia anophelis]
MKIKNKTQHQNSVSGKKEYLTPKVEVTFVEMEQGIAAASATVSPVLTNGNTDPVATDWNTTEDNNVDVESPF